jgi:hypothetical protein
MTEVSQSSSGVQSENQLSRHIIESLETRKKEIVSKGLEHNYKADFLRMQVLEGSVGIHDSREEGPISLQTRIFLGRNIDGLPTSINESNTRFSKGNDTVFASLFFDTLAIFNNGVVVINDPKHIPEHRQPGNNALITLTDHYKKINEGRFLYPLTIIYAHGDIVNGKHYISSGQFDDNSTSHVLSELIKQYPIPSETSKIPLLLVSCNFDEDGDSHADVSHPKMIIAYRKGPVSHVYRGPSEVRVSK